MHRSLKEILASLYAMVNESDNLQMNQYFTVRGKHNGSIFISRPGELQDTIFRFCFSCTSTMLAYNIKRGNSQTKILPTIYIAEGATPEMYQAAIEIALRDLTRFLRATESGKNP